MSQSLPVDERYELARQLRRAALAVPTNIAEGAGHESRREFARYLNIASGSISECEYLLIASRDLGCLDQSAHADLDAETRQIRRMLMKFRKAVTADAPEGTRMSHTNTAPLKTDG